MSWTIIITPAAKKEAKKLGRSAELEVIRFLETRVATAEDPRQFGKALSGGLAGL